MRKDVYQYGVYVFDGFLPYWKAYSFFSILVLNPCIWFKQFERTAKILEESGIKKMFILVQKFKIPNFL